MGHLQVDLRGFSSYYHFKDIMSSKVAKRSGFAEKMKKVSESQTPNRKVNFNFQISLRRAK